MTPPRNDNETASCPVCAAAFRPVRRQAYCRPACRQAAWRSRHANAVLDAARPAVPRRGRRQISVYSCPDCEQRYLGSQWCDDCARPFTLVGIGGLCPCCEEPISIDELLTQHDHKASSQTRSVR